MNNWREIYADDLSTEWIPHKFSAELETGEIEEIAMELQVDISERCL